MNKNAAPAPSLVARSAARSCTAVWHQAGQNASLLDGPHGFALHTVAARDVAGAATVGDVEAAFTQQFAAAVASGAFMPLLDFSTAFWVSTIDPYLAAFEAGGEPVFPLRWHDEEGAAFW